MKKAVFGLMGLMAMVLLSACGGDTKTYVTEEVYTDEPYEVPGGMAVIIDESNGSVVTVDNQIITIDCGEGGCGDVTVGTPVDK